MIDWTKPLQTDEKPPRKVRLLGELLDSPAPMVVAIESLDGDGQEYSAQATRDGWRQGCSSIVNAPQKLVRWVNVYSGNLAGVYATKALADASSVHGRVACIRIEFTEGQFDE